MADTNQLPAPRRRRSRGRELKIDDTEIANRVLKFFEDDDTARSAEKERRIQLYAKYRMWVEGGKDFPWPDASDFPLPDMMEKSLRMQDTLHNAVMSSRPVIGAKALDRVDADKEANVDKMIHYQLFVEQPGEEWVGDMSDAFINDGLFVVFTPWITEERETSDVRRFPPIPDDMPPIDYFAAAIQQVFAEASALPANGSDGWDWSLLDPKTEKPIAVSFYTRKGRGVDMVIRKDATVFDGPRPMLREWDEVLYPARAANLHIPGPSNPHGAPHVILVDYPTVDEIRRLAKSGFYDRLTKKDLDALALVPPGTKNQEMREEKDALQGVTPAPVDKTKWPEHGTLTRLMCFDIYDIDGDGQTEDVVWWVILETKTLVRAKWLSEAFPSNKLRRPLVHRAMVPVRGRVGGISLLEMMEGLHDVAKTVLDQTVDSGTIKNVPFFFYRPSGSMKSEIIRMVPGEGYPLNDPKRDVEFPQFNNNDQVFGINLLTIMMNMQGKLTMVDDLQEGRVPEGKSSALRTVGGMALIAGQGEARPERILRRFFSGFAEIWSQVHGLNQIFLPAKKKIRVIGLKAAGEDPYLELGRGDVSGTFEFIFGANVLNASKAALQQSIDALMLASVSELTLQTGIMTVDGLYKLLREKYIAHGQDPDKFLSLPSPTANKRRIFAEEAISQIIDGEIPDGEPAEAGGAMEHAQKLAAFTQDDNFGILTPEHVEIFKAYLQEVSEKAALQQEQQQMLEAARNVGGAGGGGGQVGRPPEGPPQSADLDAPLQSGELRDETLPGAGGGGNTGVGP